MQIEEKSLIDTGFVNRITELPITRREEEILIHLAQGQTNKQISQELILSTSTVRNHISNIFAKLKISNRSQATAIAIYAGLLNKTLVEEKPVEAVTEEAKSPL